MSHTKLNEILDGLDALDDEELELVNRALQQRLRPESEEHKRERFHRSLLDDGLVKEIKTGRSPSSSNRTLIEVKGKPVSETIIEERR